MLLNLKLSERNRFKVLWASDGDKEEEESREKKPSVPLPLIFDNPCSVKKGVIRCNTVADRNMGPDEVDAGDGVSLSALWVCA